MINTAKNSTNNIAFQTISSGPSPKFMERLGNCFWSERELENLLPILATQSTSYELSSAINEHLNTTKRQVVRLIHVFDSMQERVVGIKCQTMSHFIKEAQELADTYSSGYPRDNAIILQCQKIMSHEITTLTLLQLEALMNHEEVIASYLGAAIEEEKNAHSLLTEIALQSIYFDQAV